MFGGRDGRGAVARLGEGEGVVRVEDNCSCAARLSSIVSKVAGSGCDGRLVSPGAGVVLVDWIAESSALTSRLRPGRRAGEGVVEDNIVIWLGSSRGCRRPRSCRLARWDSRMTWTRMASLEVPRLASWSMNMN